MSEHILMWEREREKVRRSLIFLKNGGEVAAYHVAVVKERKEK